MLSLPAFIDKHHISKITFNRGVLHFGSLKTLFLFSEDQYKDFFEFLYRLWMEEVPPNSSPSDFDAIIYVFESEEAFSSKYHFRGNPIFYHDEENDWYQIRSDHADAYILNDEKPKKIFVPIDPAADTPEPLLNFLLSAFNKVLFTLGMLHVHGSAINYKGKTSLYIGDKGVGKTTISLWLAKQGATIMGEDHIMLKREGGSYFASGCDNIMRITDKTEKIFFDEELPITPKDFDGVLKKEITLSDYFETNPYADEAVGLVFFPSVKDKFALHPLDKSAALLHFLERIQPRNRFADNQDIMALMDYLADFLESVAVYELELSENIHDLRQLVEFLEIKRE